MALDAGDPKVRAAVLGRQVQDFLEGDIGVYLVGRAEEQAALAVQKLKVVAPWRRRRIRQLQNQVAVAESVLVWLADAVAAGRSATQIIKDEQEGLDG